MTNDGSLAIQSSLIGEILVSGFKVSQQEVEDALTVQRSGGGLLGEILSRIGAASEEVVLSALAIQTGYSVAALIDVPRESLVEASQKLGFSLEEIRNLGAVVWVDDAGNVHATAGNPLHPDIQETLGTRAAEAPVEWHFSRLQERESILESLDIVSDTPSSDIHRLRELAEDAPVIAFVNNLLAQAVDSRASDVHVEPGERELAIRMRIDGVLRDHLTLPIARYAAIASRIKLIGRLDIAERRLPQDGRISLRLGGGELDVRVSSIPAVTGESIVMRLLPKHRGGLDIARLGLESDHAVVLTRWITRPTGLILVTGPTGSGKSTTLYAALSAIGDRTRKVVTVEDPVEYRLPHVMQIQTHAEIGYTFARALRAILRHDPDVIMIGEIRDRETAEIAIQSALTGHLVVSTLHTNDALSAITRLVDMGVERFLVGAALRGVMAQRLVRRLCPACARSSSSPPLASSVTMPETSIPPRWMEPVGCAECHGTGFRGRLGIYEFVDIDDDIQGAISAGAATEVIERMADERGRRNLFADGLLKAREGLTTIDEVLRVVGADQE